jgi:hypothetical protein
MNDIKKRFLLFLIGCIGTRILFVLVAKYISLKYLPLLGYLAILPMIGFMYIYLTGSRKTGAEVFGGKIWWNDLRPLHALLYGLFAYSVIQRSNISLMYSAWMFLLADVVIGLGAFLVYHYRRGDFAKL